MYFKVGLKLFWVTLKLAQKSGIADGRPIFPLFLDVLGRVSFESSLNPYYILICSFSFIGSD